MIPVLRLTEVGTRVFLHSYLRQFQNATVLHLQMEGVTEDSRTEKPRPHVEWSVSISPEYECYWAGGGGSGDRWDHRFVVSPPLPDDVEGVHFVFTWQSRGPDEALHDEQSGTVTL